MPKTPSDLTGNGQTTVKSNPAPEPGISLPGSQPGVSAEPPNPGPTEMKQGKNPKPQQKDKNKQKFSTKKTPEENPKLNEEIWKRCLDLLFASLNSVGNVGRSISSVKNFTKAIGNASLGVVAGIGAKITGSKRLEKFAERRFEAAKGQALQAGVDLASTIPLVTQRELVKNSETTPKKKQEPPKPTPDNTPNKKEKEDNKEELDNGVVKKKKGEEELKKVEEQSNKAKANFGTDEKNEGKKITTDYEQHKKTETNKQEKDIGIQEKAEKGAEAEHKASLGKGLSEAAQNVAKNAPKK